MRSLALKTLLLLLVSSHSVMALDPEALILSSSRFCNLMQSRLPQDFARENILKDGKIPISTNKIQSKDAFQIIEKVWTEDSKFEEMRPIIKSFKEGDFSDVTKKLKAQIRDARETGNTLRVGFAFFSRDHAFPSEEVDQFIIDYGKLKDALKAKNYDAVQKFAARIYKQFRTIPESDLLEDFKPAKAKDFANYVQNRKKYVLDRLNEESLITDEYHMQRKVMRGFAIAFALQAALKPTDLQLEQTYRYLIKISDDLAVAHTKLVKDVFKHGVDENNQYFEIPYELKERIRFFFEHLDIQR